MTLPDITNKQQEIPPLLYRFRFINTTHIQHFFHHKDKRNSNRLLKDLVIKEYVGRIYDGTIIGKNRVPAVYFLGKNGIRFLKAMEIIDGSSMHKLYYEKDRSRAFIEHCLLIAEICCQLEKKESQALSYEYTTESDYSNIDNPFHFLKDSALPVDLCSGKKQKGKKIQYFLLTLFAASLPRYRIRKRIKDYYQFYFSNEWEGSIDASFPVILFIFQSKEQLIYAKRLTKTMLEQDEPEDLSIHFALSEDVKKFGITGRIWEEIVYTPK